MPELVVLGIRVGLLVLLWLFVLLAIRAARTDLFRSTAQAPAATGAPAPARPASRSHRPPPRAPARHLVVTAGPLAGRSVPLDGSPVLLGRADDSTLVLDADEYASTRHARLTLRGETWYVEDLGSTNGTYLGPHKVTDPAPVPPGEPIRVGTTTLELRR